MQYAMLNPPPPPTDQGAATLPSKYETSVSSVPATPVNRQMCGLSSLIFSD